MLNRLACAAVIGSAAAGTLAQTDVLYISDASGSNRLNRFQGGGTLGQTALSGFNELALAVAGDVRTFGSFVGTVGHQYTLSGAATGTTYAWSGPGRWQDGTTDGTNNYSVAYPSGQVYAFDRDWQSPTPLFTTGDHGGYGITYDSKNGTLWLTNQNSNRIEEYTLGGSLLSSFSTGEAVLVGLAYEPSTDTLWLTGKEINLFQQYSKSGVHLQDVYPSGLSGAVGAGGAEFDIPAPGTFALLSVGCPAAARRRRA